MDIYFCCPVNQNIPPIALNKIIFAMFFGIKCYINQARNSYIYKSLCKCLHNITRYKTVKFGVLLRRRFRTWGTL